MRIVTRVAGVWCILFGVAFLVFGAMALTSLQTPAVPAPPPEGGSLSTPPTEQPIDLGAAIERAKFYARIAAWLLLGTVASFAIAIGGTACLVSAAPPPTAVHAGTLAT